jgi:APA family basic amino acid/polyamine antiporter
VLIYYAIAHASAFSQPAGERWLHRWVQVAGILGCLVLAFTLPGVLATVAWLIFGLALRKFRHYAKPAAR